MKGEEGLRHTCPQRSKESVAKKTGELLNKAERLAQTDKAQGIKQMYRGSHFPNAGREKGRTVRLSGKNVN